MATKKVLGTVAGKPVRFSYVNAFKPRLNAESGVEEYSITVLIPKGNTEDVQAVKDAINAELNATFKVKGRATPPKAWIPLRDGDTDVKMNGSAFGPECKGHYVLQAKQKADKGKPGIVDAQMQAIIDPAGLQSGDWGAVSVSFYGYDKGTGGVGVGLLNIQKRRSGEPLGSSSRAEDDFTAVEEDFLA